MLEKISLIASFIIALTSITTSLRAAGKSREFFRDESISKLMTSARVSDCKISQPDTKGKPRLQCFIATVIWFILSVVFAVPFLVQQWKSQKDFRIFIWGLPFLLLGVFLWFIWSRILHLEN